MTIERLLISGALAWALIWSPRASAAPVTLKIATVMPRGGPWATALSRFAADVRRLTKRQVHIKMYYGGVAGTEARAVARMKAGQIHGVAVASVGLSAIDPAVRVLELPLLYRTHQEFRFVSKSMLPVLTKRLAASRYQLLALTGAGWVQMYSKRALRTLADVRGGRIWTWKHDPSAAALFRVLGIRGTRLPLASVLPSLQSGTVHTAYGMAHAAQALQWHTSTRYVMDLRIAMAIAALIVRKDTFDRLTAAQRKIVLERAAVLQRTLNRSCRRINSKAMRAMVQGGLRPVKMSADFKRRLQKLRTRIWGALKGKMYEPADLKKVRALLSLCRSTSCRS